MKDEYKFRIKPSGLKKTKREDNRAFKASYLYLLKSLRNNQSISLMAGPKAYRSTQKCMVKVSYASNNHKGQWSAHGRYLGRKGAQREDEKGLGFNDTDEEISIAKTLNSWQIDSDPRIWKLIISPERAADLGLKEHTRELMKRVEKDLGLKLQWVAIDHYNTLHFHVHLVIRGISDDGRELRFEKKYIKEGFRDRSQQIITAKLGLRTGLDMLENRREIIKARHITEIDREINNKLTKDHFYNLDWCTKNGYLYQKNLQIKQRLQYLETLGLAKEFTSASWHVSPTFLEHLKFMQEGDDIVKSQRRHYDQIIDKDLKTISNKLPNVGDTIIGRVIGTGLSERDEDFRYIFIEGIDAKIHYVKANSKVLELRDNYQLKAGNIIHLERKNYIKDNKTIPYLDVNVFSDFGSLRTATEITSIDRYIANRVIINGYIPETKETANAVRVEFMKIVQGRVNYLKRQNILNEDLQVIRSMDEQQVRLKRGLG